MDDNYVFADEDSRSLMVCVSPLVGHSLVRDSNLAHRLAPIATAFLLSGLVAFEPAQML